MDGKCHIRPTKMLSDMDFLCRLLSWVIILWICPALFARGPGNYFVAGRARQNHRSFFLLNIFWFMFGLYVFQLPGTKDFTSTWASKWSSSGWVAWCGVRYIHYFSSTAPSAVQYRQMEWWHTSRRNGCLILFPNVSYFSCIPYPRFQSFH